MKKRDNINGESIIALIFSIIFPPIGLLMSYILKKDNNNILLKISNIIGLILTIIYIAIIVIFFVFLAANMAYDNNIDDNISKCMEVYSCDEDDDSDGYSTCYYCVNNNCGNKEKITCPAGSAPNNNYSSVDYGGDATSDDN